jgi:hypothetical protein
MAKMIEHRDAMTPEQGDSENYHFRIQRLKSSLRQSAPRGYP